MKYDRGDGRDLELDGGSLANGMGKSDYGVRAHCDTGCVARTGLKSQDSRTSLGCIGLSFCRRMLHSERVGKRSYGACVALAGEEEEF